MPMGSQPKVKYTEEDSWMKLGFHLIIINFVLYIKPPKTLINCNSDWKQPYEKYEIIHVKCRYCSCKYGSKDA